MSSENINERLAFSFMSTNRLGTIFRGTIFLSLGDYTGRVRHVLRPYNRRNGG